MNQAGSEGSGDYFQRVARAVEHIAGKLTAGSRPRVGLTLGTGLSGLGAGIKDAVRLVYSQIPGFPLSTVESHQGTLILGELAGQQVAALAGRFHLYEGYTPQEVTFPVRVLAQLGVEVFIFCNAAGGLEPSWQPGKVMLITDHINFTGCNPLTGPNQEHWGERFPDMSQVYHPVLMDLARAVARAEGIEMYQGVYVGLQGPSMETPAETRMLTIIGAQAVGMSTVLEVIAAKHHGLKILAFSAIANINDPARMEPAPLEMIIENASRAGQDLSTIIRGVLKRLPGQEKLNFLA